MAGIELHLLDKGVPERLLKGKKILWTCWAIAVSIFLVMS
jgi:hypothetical protein